MSKTMTCSKGCEGCEIIPQAVFDDVSDELESPKYFCSISLIAWIKHQVSLHYSKLRMSNRHRGNRFYYHDLSCARRYQEIVTPLEDAETLTVTVTWDGVVYTKDNAKTMWPLVAYLNELPFQDRINNPMLLALHAGRSKPKNDIMLKPMVEELLSFDLGQEDLANVKPLEIEIGGVLKKFYIKLLLFLADAPARAVVLNCSGHTAYEGMFINYYYLFWINFTYSYAMQRSLHHL